MTIRSIDVDSRHYLFDGVLYDRNSFDDPSGYDYPVRVPAPLMAMLGRLLAENAQLKEAANAEVATPTPPQA